MLGTLTKYCERIQKFRETGHLKHIYKNELDKACFAHDPAYFNSKSLTKRVVSDNILRDRACKIAINFKYNGYQKGLASMVYKFFWQENSIGSKSKCK